MTVHLVTGHKGEEHITSQDEASFNAALYGYGEFVFEYRSKLSTEAGNLPLELYVHDGDAMMQGRHIRVTDREELMFSPVGQDQVRQDLIVLRYTRDTSTDIERSDLIVIEGEPVLVGQTPNDPAFTHGDLFDSATLNDMPLYRIRVTSDEHPLTVLSALFSTEPNLPAKFSTLQALFTNAISSLNTALTNAVTNLTNAINSAKSTLQANINAVSSSVGSLGTFAKKNLPALPDANTIEFIVYKSSGTLSDAVTFKGSDFVNPTNNKYIVVNSSGNLSAVEQYGYNTSSNQGQITIGSNGITRFVNSARKYKEDIEDADIPPDFLLKLRPVTYYSKYLDDGEERAKQVGFIAEEVLAAGGELFVTYDNGHKLRGLKYDTFIVAAVSTIKSQEERISRLEERLEAVIEGRS